MCAMPHRSRTTRTGADSASTASVPEMPSGSGAGDSIFRQPPIAAHSSATAATARHRSRARTPAARSTLTVMTIKDGLLADYDHEIGTTRRLLERVPDDRLSWKPHPKSMSLGELAAHLASLPQWGGVILNGDGFDLS